MKGRFAMKAKQRFYLRDISILLVTLWMFGTANVAARDPKPVTTVPEVV
jgi:hypothetical protein